MGSAAFESRHLARVCRPAAWICACALPFSAGCASTQLNRDTRNLNQSTGAMEVTQVLDNITAFLNDENGYAVPSQIVISGGQASTQYTFTPQAQYGTSKTGQLVTTQTNGQPATNNTSATVGGAVTQSVVNGATSSLAIANQVAKVFSPQASASFADQWSQNWTIQVINDGNALRKLNNLYRYAANRDLDFTQAPTKPSVIDNPYEVSFGEYATFYTQSHRAATFDEVYSHYRSDVPGGIL